MAMSSILIDAVLSSSPDHGALFNALCWPSDSWPERERIEALTTLIDGIGKLSVNNTGFSAAQRLDFIRRVESVIWDQCLSLLSKISTECVTSSGDVTGAQDSRGKETSGAACRLLGVCVPLCGPAATRRLARSVLPTLQQPADRETEESIGPGKLHVDQAIDVMAVLLPALASDARLTAATLAAALSCIRTLSDALASKTIVRILFTLLGCHRENGSARTVLSVVLDDLCRWHAGDRSPAVTERALLCLTALSDHLLPPPAAVPSSHTPPGPPSSARPADPRRTPQFWRVLQDGLTHRDTVARKRALYLLKRCVAVSEDEGAGFLSDAASAEGEEVMFRWIPERRKLLREFWEDYVLVMETLEENQIHVVRPVLNRIDALIQTAANDNQGSGGALLHPSWLLCVYQRMFHSENKSVMKEGVHHLLELRALAQPDFSLAFSQFIVGPFMDVLSESSLFHRATGQCVGECPELGVKLQTFLVSFFRSLPPEKRGWVLLQLIQRLGSQHWCSVPILFLSQALAQLQPCPLLGPDGLRALREVLRCTMTTHQVLLRGAAQCFLLHSALCLTDVSSVTLDDVFGLLVHFRADESLCRGTGLWDQLCVWLEANEDGFRPCLEDGGACAGPSAPERGSVLGYIQRHMEAYLRVPACTDHTHSLPDPSEAERLAIAVLLWVDMEESREGGGSAGEPEEEEEEEEERKRRRRRGTAGRMEAVLRPLVDTLGRLGTNVYLPLRKTDKSLQLLLRLYQLRRTAGQTDGHTDGHTEDRVGVAMDTMVLDAVESIQEFILRQLGGALQELCDVERADLYLSVLRELALVDRTAPPPWTCLPRLTTLSLTALQQPAEQVPSVAGQVTRAVAMASLAMLCDLAKQEAVGGSQWEAAPLLLSLNGYFYPPGSAPSGRFNQPLMKPPAAALPTGASEQGPSLQDWGRTAAHFIRDQWTCLGFLRRARPPPGPGDIQGPPGALQAAMEALTLLPSDLVLPVLAYMEDELPQVALCAEAVCVDALRRSWELVQALSSNPQDFWPALRGFVCTAFSPRMLGLTHTLAPLLTHTLREISAELMALSQIKTGVFNVLIQHCCLAWLTPDPGSDSLSSALLHLDILTEACVYGPVFRRDQSVLIQEVQSYVEQLGEQCAANTVIASDNRDEHFPRVCVLAFLSRLDVSDQLHQTLMEELVLRLLKRDEEISKSKVRYYSNSLQHRVKNRAWQTLLLLLPRLRPEFVNTVVSRVFQAGFCSNQASVKYLIEWAIILVLIQYPVHMDKLWACFSLDQDKTKTSVCTYLSVLVHLNVIMPKLQDQMVQWRRAVDVSLQWCFSHSFSVRLYALLALKRLWGLAGACGAGGGAEGAGDDPDGPGALASVVRACLSQAEAMQSSGNASKNWSRIQEHFFFGAFHPTRDYSVETIFFLFPRLSELADDECVPPWKFENLVEFPEDPSLPLRNRAPDLCLVPPGDWVQQDKGDQEREERWADVQKKMTPWRLGIQEQGPELQLVPQQRASRLGRLHGALLVVASLIDKPTNLGGLCRTCEIFGASGLVLDSLRHVSDKHFQALSVSSELWLPLLEVKPAELSDFLLMKKGEGYCIIGVEQTANSQSLQDYRFPEKTLLLLGNEREGIPANLLQLLDVCVEIPQQGIIRSLNVHVSAALLVWEYTRQHLAPPRPAGDPRN